MLELDDHIAGEDLWVFTDLTHGLDFTAGNAHGPQEVDPLLGGLVQHDRFDQAAQGAAVLDAISIGAEALVVAPGVVAGGLTKGAPHAIVAAGQIDIAILTAIGLVGRDSRVLVTHARRTLASGEIDTGLIGQHGHLAVEHAEIDFLALASVCACEQGQQDALEGHHSGDDVSLGVADLIGWSLRVAGQAGDATFTLNDQIIARQVGFGTSVPKARDRAENQPRIDLAHGVIAKTKGFHGTWTKVLDQHVGGLDELAQELQRLRVLEVHCQAALTAVNTHKIGALAVDKRRTIAPRVVSSFGALHFHHIGAHIPQYHGTVRTSENPRHVQHFDTV